jgi:TonB-dependent SusC/RagA subfamily outer membrane receptor
MKTILSLIALILILTSTGFSQTTDSTKSMIILDCRPKPVTPENQPLYILKHGKEEIKQRPINLKKIQPDWIQSVDVLKGEKATEAYGVAAAHGVILITFKDEKWQDVKNALED